MTLNGIWVFNTSESTALTNKEAGITVSVFNHHKLLQPESVQLTYIMTEQAGQIGNLDSQPYASHIFSPTKSGISVSPLFSGFFSRKPGACDF